MKLYIDQTPLKNGNVGRGVGVYTKMLDEALRKYSGVELVDSIKEAEVIHYPFFDLFFNTLPLTTPAPTVVTVHDVIPLVFKQLYPPGIKGEIRFWWQNVKLKSKNLVVTDSECSTLDSIRYLKLTHEKVKTVYLAANENYQPVSEGKLAEVKNRYNLNKPYFLYVGDINPNKGLEGLFEAFAKLNPSVELVLASKNLTRDNVAAKHLFKLIDKLRIEASLKVIDNVRADDFTQMSALYAGALAYIQPSLYEGFGLPVLEAQQCGTPVISTHGGSLQEIVGESSLIVDAGSIESMTNGMKTALNWNRTERETLIELGFENIKRFSWKKTALMMEQLYESINQ